MRKQKKPPFILPEGRTPDIFDKIMSLPVLNLLNPFFQKHRKILMYLFFGGVTTVVSWVTFWLFRYPCGWHELIANLVSWIVTVFVAFITNRIWVFQSKTRGATAYFIQMLRFYGSRVLTFLIEQLLLFIFATMLGIEDMIVKIAASVIVVILNYVFSVLLVFRKKKAESKNDPDQTE